jgi:hypothetical protein
MILKDSTFSRMKTGMNLDEIFLCLFQPPRRD